MRYVVAFVGLLLCGYLLTGLSQVRPGERAVVRRLGRVVATPGPGLWIGLPYPFERVDRVPVDMIRRVRVGYEREEDENEATTPPGQFLTGDHNLVNIQILVDYSIQDDEVEDYVVQAERVEGMIARGAEAALSSWSAGRRVDDILLRGKVDLPLRLPGKIQEDLEPCKLGIVIQGVSVSYLFPPDEVRSAFDEVSRAQTGISTSVEQAQQEAAQRLRQGETEQARLERLARAYAAERRVLAKAEAAAFLRRLDQYRRLKIDNPSILAGIWWDEMGSLLKSMKDKGRIELLDQHLAGDGLDITIAPPPIKKSN